MGRDAFIGNWEALRDLHTVIVIDTHTSALQRVVRLSFASQACLGLRKRSVN
jgi:hypothetical protein